MFLADRSPNLAFLRTWHDYICVLKSIIINTSHTPLYTINTPAKTWVYLCGHSDCSNLLNGPLKIDVKVNSQIALKLSRKLLVFEISFSRGHLWCLEAIVTSGQPLQLGFLRWWWSSFSWATLASHLPPQDGLRVTQMAPGHVKPVLTHVSCCRDGLPLPPVSRSHSIFVESASAISLCIFNLL
jgi:hypothetical protein